MSTEIQTERQHNFGDELTESWRLTGQELMDFVLKTSESLHNVINMARITSMQLSARKKKTSKRKSTLKNINKTNLKKCRINEKTETNDELNATPVSTQSSVEYDFEWTSSSCEELNDIPMEELLSSPTWKQIVRQNTFVWP